MPFRPRRRRVAAALCLALAPLPAVARARGSVDARASVAAERCADGDAMPGLVPDQTIQAATLCLMNAERAARGVRALHADADLARVARGYANQMVRQGFFAHTSPAGSTMLSRIRSTRYLRDVRSWSVGENLAWGTGPLATPRATVRAWMDSPGHRRNLLDRSFADVGIGVVAGAPTRLDPGEAGGTYVTDFGRRVRP
jgi:uncharacterized protein YkwD